MKVHYSNKNKTNDQNTLYIRFLTFINNCYRFSILYQDGEQTPTPLDATHMMWWESRRIYTIGFVLLWGIYSLEVKPLAWRIKDLSMELTHPELWLQKNAVSFLWRNVGSLRSSKFCLLAMMRFLKLRFRSKSRGCKVPNEKIRVVYR